MLNSMYVLCDLDQTRQAQGTGVYQLSKTTTTIDSPADTDTGHSLLVLYNILTNAATSNYDRSAKRRDR
jgi:hypothetical protein